MKIEKQRGGTVLILQAILRYKAACSFLFSAVIMTEERYLWSFGAVASMKFQLVKNTSLPHLTKEPLVRKEMILLVSSTSTKRPTKLTTNTAPTELMDHLPPPTEPHRVPRLQDRSRRLTI